VVGNSSNAVKEALFLTHFAVKVILIHPTETLLLGPELKGRLFSETKVEVVNNSSLSRILGENKVTGVQLKNLKTGEETSLEVDGVFIFTGFQPSTGFLPPGVKTTEQGHIITDEKMETFLSGLFACGDCRQKVLRQVVTACADGALTVSSAQKYLERL